MSEKIEDELRLAAQVEYLQAFLQTPWPSGLSYTTEAQAKFDRAVGERAVLNTLIAKRAALAPISHHGGRSYSVEGAPPVCVSVEEDMLLTAFETQQRALNRAELEGVHGISNAPRAVKRLRARYGRMFANAIRQPGKKGRGGYFARVQPVA
jgi:hypothetical protein